jgi:hypothetical protein
MRKGNPASAPGREPFSISLNHLCERKGHNACFCWGQLPYL